MALIRVEGLLVSSVGYKYRIYKLRNFIICLNHNLSSGFFSAYDFRFQKRILFKLSLRCLVKKKRNVWVPDFSDVYL